jgi:hypothetical protein
MDVGRDVAGETKWLCCSCEKVLGVIRKGRLHLRFARHEYVVALPASSVCPSCGALNEVQSPPTAAQSRPKIR